jgi:hypothetical protein
VPLCTDVRASIVCFGARLHLSVCWSTFQGILQVLPINDARPVDKAIVKGQTFEEWAADHKDELLAQFDKQH